MSVSTSASVGIVTYFDQITKPHSHWLRSRTEFQTAPIAFGHRHFAHVIAEACHLAIANQPRRGTRPLRQARTESSRQPNDQTTTLRSMRKRTANETEFAVTVRRPIQVHEIHVNG